MRLLGTVKWFNEEKGYGFIRCDNQDYFVHIRGLIKKFTNCPLYDGVSVYFTPKKTDKGFSATEVSLLSDEASPLIEGL